MKKILGLDIGTNSIGWSVIEQNLEERQGKILGMGSRIISMEGREKDFEAGKSVTKMTDRRISRGARRLLQRYRLRRERLIIALKELGWFPGNFPTYFKDIKKFNINEIVPFDKKNINEAKELFNTENISTDWVIYYLRTKALKEKINLSEFARILYHFNQRRGFKSSRKDRKIVDENEEIKYPLREKHISILNINSVEETDEKTRYGKVFNIHVTDNDGHSYKGTTIKREKPDWQDQKIELDVTKITNKAGEVHHVFRLPDRTDWEKMKIALERDIEESGLQVSEYFLGQLRNDRNYRIKDRIIDRKKYQKEFDAIWAKQAEFHPELNSHEKLETIARIFYKHNEAKVQELTANDLKYLFKNDIIYFQRDLRSQKHLIAECPYEKKKFIDKNGKVRGYKVAPKSSPIFQEFRIWKTIHNIRIIRLEEKKLDGKIKHNIDITDEMITIDAKEKLFELFDSRASVSHTAILKILSESDEPINAKTHKLNYPPEKDFKGNETKSKFISIFKKFNYENEGKSILNDPVKLQKLWHIIYSLNDEKHIENALMKNFSLPKDIVVALSQLPEYSKNYASYSAKAIEKLLSVMRCGKYWNEQNIFEETKNRIEDILQGKYGNIKKEAKKELERRQLKSIEDFNSFPDYLACYLVYGRHSEKINEGKFQTPKEIKLLPQNSLRNPIVEQIVNETLQVVKDIWNKYEQPDEIHIELARDLKQNAEDRKKKTNAIFNIEKDRKRIVSILKELNNANPESPIDIEKLRLWEQTGNETAVQKFPKFSKEPTKIEIDKYKLWGEQNHISPYTKKVISLSKLFTSEYEIEHIIPKSRFFDNSFANKTICEASVNKFKDKKTAMQMINENGGREIAYKGKKFVLLSSEEYVSHINKTFHGRKRRNLLSESIPEDFVARQLNDTRYINKKLSELLEPAAKGDIVFTIGSITNELKNNWGLKSVWKELLKPRFERLEKITGQKLIDITKENKIRFKKDFKRIDHRHHALDALVIACTSHSHIQYLNTLNAYNNDDRFKQKYWYLTRAGVRDFVLPWDTFTKEAKEKLQGIIVSHKNRTRIVTKGFNLYTKWKLKNGKWKKEKVKQEKGELFSVRKSMFKEPFGRIKLAEYKKNVLLSQAVKIQYEYLTNYSSKTQSRIADKNLRKSINELISNCNFDLKTTLDFIKKNDDWKNFPKVDILQFNEYAAKRVALDASFDIKKIDKIPYANHKNNKLVKTLKEHLTAFDNKSHDAFSAEGLDILAKKFGKPITKITIYETIGKKQDFNGKLVEADKGTNLFFVIYENLNEPYDRIINKDSSISLLDAIDCFTNKIPIGEEKVGYKKIILSPNDLVYVPAADEDIKNVDWDDKKKVFPRVYKMVNCTTSKCLFIPHFIAQPILDTVELGSNNISERSWDGTVEYKKNSKGKLTRYDTGRMIKNVCIKLKIDRLGNIRPVN